MDALFPESARERLCLPSAPKRAPRGPLCAGVSRSGWSGSQWREPRVEDALAQVEGLPEADAEFY